MSNDDKPEVEYLLTEKQTLYLVMLARLEKEQATEEVKDIFADMVKVVYAWRRGKLLPRWEAPKLADFCKEFERPDWPPQTPPKGAA
jgi:hypothetical protein